MPDAQGLKSLGGGSPSGESPCFLTAREWCTSRLRLGCALQKAVGGAVVWCWHGSCGMPARAKGKGAVKGRMPKGIRLRNERESVRFKWAQAHRGPRRSSRRLRWTLRVSVHGTEITVSTSNRAEGGVNSGSAVSADLWCGRLRAFANRAQFGNSNMVKRIQVCGGCLGAIRRGRPWLAAIIHGEEPTSLDPWVAEWGNPAVLNDGYPCVNT